MPEVGSLCVLFFLISLVCIHMCCGEDFHSHAGKGFMC